MGIKPSVSVGDKFTTKSGYPYTVIDYKGAYEVTVRFDDDSAFEVTTHAGNVKTGSVKNPFLPSVYGVGFIGLGEYRSQDEGVINPAYSRWLGMFIRCYRKKIKPSDSSYIDCYVAPEWHNYQVFAKWYYGQPNYNAGYHLDKDLLKQGNRVYSPEFCCLIPAELNAMIVKPALSKSGLPTGVNKTKNGRFRVRLSEDGRSKFLGSFDTIDEAKDAYVAAKESYVRKKAKEWQGFITLDAYKSLVEWRAPNE